MRALAAAAVVVAVLASCTSAPRERETGSHAPPEGSCLDNEVGRAYLAELWQTLQDAWILPKGIPPDQQAELVIPFDGDGNPGEPFIARDTNEALRASVEAAIGRAELPPTPDEIRTCIAGLRLSGVFRNPDPPR